MSFLRFAPKQVGRICPTSGGWGCPKSLGLRVHRRSLSSKQQIRPKSFFWRDRICQNQKSRFVFAPHTCDAEDSASGFHEPPPPSTKKTFAPTKKIWVSSVVSRLLRCRRERAGDLNHPHPQRKSAHQPKPMSAWMKQGHNDLLRGNGEPFTGCTPALPAILSPNEVTSHVVLWVMR